MRTEHSAWGQIADADIVCAETSKRLGINQREKVQKKVKETRRKKTKQAKKNPQWKSSACLFCPLGCEGEGQGDVFS